MPLILFWQEQSSVAYRNQQVFIKQTIVGSSGSFIEFVDDPIYIALVKISFINVVLNKTLGLVLSFQLPPPSVFYYWHTVYWLFFLPQTLFVLACRWWLWPQCTWPRQWDSVLSGLPGDIPEQHSVWVGDQRAPWQQDPLSLCWAGHRRQWLPGQLPPPLQRHWT